MSDQNNDRYAKKLKELLADLSRYNLTGKVIQNSDARQGFGGACDVFLGRYQDKTVAIKKLRVHSSQMSNVQKVSCEYVICQV